MILYDAIMITDMRSIVCLSQLIEETVPKPARNQPRMVQESQLYSATLQTPAEVADIYSALVLVLQLSVSQNSVGLSYIRSCCQIYCLLLRQTFKCGRGLWCSCISNSSYYFLCYWYLN